MYTILVLLALESAYTWKKKKKKKKKKKNHSIKLYQNKLFTELKLLIKLFHV